MLAAAAMAQNPVVRNLSCVAGSGSSSAYSCNMPSAPPAYVTGTQYAFQADVANSGVATVNFNSLGAKGIKKLQGGSATDLAANDIRAGQWVVLMYDGTNMQMLSQLGNGTSGGGAWGSITGTLSSQTDLQNALNGLASLSGSYANPAWITSLAWSKVTGAPSTFNAGQLQGRTMASTAPSDQQYLGWSATNSQWQPISIPSGTAYPGAGIAVSTGSAWSGSISPGSAGHVVRSNGSSYADAAIQASDVPTLNQNTTGTAANVTGIVAEANGGTGAANTPGAAGHVLRSNGTHYVDGTMACGDLSNAGSACQATAPSGTIVGTTDTQTLSGKTLTNPSLGAASSALTETMTVGAGGVTAGTFVKLDTTADNQVVAIGTVDTKWYGVAMATKSAGQSVEVTVAGSVTVSADGPYTRGNAVIASTTTAGYGHDSGTTRDGVSSQNSVATFRASCSSSCTTAAIEILRTDRGIQVPYSQTTGITAGAIGAASLASANSYSGGGMQDLSAMDVKMPVHSSDPGTCAAGQLEFNSTTGSFKGCTATNTWGAIGGAGALTVTTQAGTSYTLQASDNGTVIQFTNSGSVTLTVPSGLGAGFNVGIIQAGTGTVTPTASSTTLHQRLSLTKTAGQYAYITLVAYAADNFLLSGDLQ